MEKSIFKKYSEYLKDNPEGYWFKRKVYGWGWVPANLKGWISTFIFMLAVIFLGMSLSLKGEPSNIDLILFFGELIMLILVIFGVCYKTGERPKWSWGFEK